MKRGGIITNRNKFILGPSGSVKSFFWKPYGTTVLLRTGRTRFVGEIREITYQGFM